MSKRGITQRPAFEYSRSFMAIGGDYMPTDRKPSKSGDKGGSASKVVMVPSLESARGAGAASGCCMRLRRGAPAASS